MFDRGFWYYWGLKSLSDCTVLSMNGLPVLVIRSMHAVRIEMS